MSAKIILQNEKESVSIFKKSSQSINQATNSTVVHVNVKNLQV